MTTKAHSKMLNTARAWEDQMSSAVFSGIVGDTNHPDGMHISFEDNPSGNWSISRPPDKPPKMVVSLEEYAAAIDMSMNKTDMVTTHKRVHAVWADHDDPRRKFFLAFNVWDGSGDAVRLDFDKNTANFASSDHQTHTHGELHRMFINDDQAYRAWLSMTGGQSKADWIYQEDEMGSFIIGVEKGEDGADVKCLQNLLRRGGYDPGSSGVYDDKTVAAVKKCRTDMGQTGDFDATKISGDAAAQILAAMAVRYAKDYAGKQGPPGSPGSPGAPGAPGEDGVPQPGQEFMVRAV